jgi:hypothetical protein
VRPSRTANRAQPRVAAGATVGAWLQPEVPMALDVAPSNTETLSSPVSSPHTAPVV